MLGKGIDLKKCNLQLRVINQGGVCSFLHHRSILRLPWLGIHTVQFIYVTFTTSLQFCAAILFTTSFISSAFFQGPRREEVSFLEISLTLSSANQPCSFSPCSPFPFLSNPSSDAVPICSFTHPACYPGQLITFHSAISLLWRTNWQQSDQSANWAANSKYSVTVVLQWLVIWYAT